MLAVGRILAIALGICSHILHAGTLDQSHTDGSGNAGAPFLAQTFTVGIGGFLDQVDIEVDLLANATLEIRPTVAGVPALGGTALGEVLVPDDVPNGNRTFVSVDLASLNIAVNPGDQLAIVLVFEELGSTALWVLGGDGYSGGHGYFSTSSSSWEMYDPPGDFNFRTYVIPEPSAAVLTALGFVCLLAWRCKNDQPLSRLTHISRICVPIR